MSQASCPLRWRRTGFASFFSVRVNLRDRADRGELTGELSDMTFLLSPSLSRITAKLAARGLITKEVNPSHLRSSLLNIYETGRALISRMAPKSEEGYRAIEDSFGKDRLDQLHHLLQDLAATEVCKET